jgi:hypothetical protein
VIVGIKTEYFMNKSGRNKMEEYNTGKTLEKYKTIFNGNKIRYNLL